MNGKMMKGIAAVRKHSLPAAGNPGRRTGAALACSLIALLTVLSVSAEAQPGGRAGAFTRLGFGARGHGMGNALTAVNTGHLTTVYNPALSPFQKSRLLYGSYGMLALDRKLNQISYIQPIRIEKKGARKYAEDPDAQSLAGVSAGWINAGDADIQGYDSDGFKTEMLSVFENQFFLNFGTRFSERLSVGFNAKFYYSGLYRDVTSSGFGIDLGALYQVAEGLTVAVVVQDLLTKYKWDTGKLYGPEQGRATEDAFPLITRFGAAYIVHLMEGGLIAADMELFDGGAPLARIGGELRLAEQFTIRAGADRIDLGGSGIDARPSAGVSFSQPVASLRPEIQYAFILEPVAPSPTHVLSFLLSF
jgi:hypothetical protein